MKNKGVSAKIHEDFYRKMEALRIQLKNKYGIKVSSHVKLTKMMANNKGLLDPKQYRSIKKW